MMNTHTDALAAIRNLSSQLEKTDLRDAHKEEIVGLLDQAAAQLSWAIRESEMYTPEEIERQKDEALLRLIFA